MNDMTGRTRQEDVRHAAGRVARSRGVLVMLDPAPAQELPADLYPLVDLITQTADHLGEQERGELAIGQQRPVPDRSRIAHP